jgi:hypothetical protein
MGAIKLFPVRQNYLPYCAGLALLVSACGGGSNVASVGSTDAGTSACPTGIGGLPVGCCDSTGVAISPPPAGVTGCATLTPGTGPIASTGGNGAGSAGGATSDLGTASQLVGSGAATGMSGQYAGATAGGIQPAVAQLANVVPNAAGIAAGALTPTSGSASGGGGSGSGAGGLDDTSTITAAASPDPMSSSSLLGANGDAPYAASGATAGGVLPNGAKASGFQFGNGFAGPEGTVASSMAFGNGSSVDPMLGGDPEDYFTRIGLEDSLFKKVERRYRDTSVQWASVQPMQTLAPARGIASVPNGAAK